MRIKKKIKDGYTFIKRNRLLINDKCDEPSEYYTEWNKTQKIHAVFSHYINLKNKQS